MQRSLIFRCTFISLATMLCFVTAFSMFLSINHASSAYARNVYVPLQGSSINVPVGAHFSGHRNSTTQLTITLVLQPNDVGQLGRLLQEFYDPTSSLFHHWLAKGDFNRRFAPGTSQVAQINTFLQAADLQAVASPTPFLERATGTTAHVEAAFHTTINDYRAASGQQFFQNVSPVQVPIGLRSAIVAVSGLSNTNTLHPHYTTTREAARKQGKAIPHYGAAPGGNGLTPSQITGIYDAGSVYHLGNDGKGQGSTLAVFELAGYTSTDITTYEHTFFGASENVPLVNINVDGGPVTPLCPADDVCGPFIPGGPCANGCNSADYTGDIEVVADIEAQIAIAPKANRILVYDAPSDKLGITGIDEYYKIANDDLADSISISWGVCEQDAGLATAQAESMAFMQMAAQGQSVFSATGDTGAFDCLRSSLYETGIAVDDPTSQQFMTSVGGTSLGTFDPGSNQHPSYPTGFETVWNVVNACTFPLLNYCLDLGAGGGGVSTFWRRPSFQYGLGVSSSFSQKGPYCNQAAKGQYCREIPDVSANADEFTPYAEYCTGDPNTNSTCAIYQGWLSIGGTSLSSPVWSGIIALWDSVHKARFGCASYGLYQLLRLHNSYSLFFHDITGKNQTENNNGYYPTTSNYDMATGIGTPRISGIVEANF